MKPGILKVVSSLNSLLFNKIRQLSTDTIKVKPHVPLIKFRKGSSSKSISSEQNLVSQTHHSSSPVQKSNLDEDMTPIKYRRKTLSQLEMEIIEGKEIRDLYTASLENLLKSGELNHFKYSDLIEKFKPEIEDLVLKCSDKETDLDVEYYFYNLRFGEILYPRTRYASYYLLYLETKYKKVLTLKYSVKFIEHFKLEDENVTPQHISIFKIQYKLKEKSTQDKIKQVLSRPEDAYINDKFFLDKLNKEMNDKFISLYKEMYLEIAPLYYILSRYCVELRIEDSSLEHNEFGRRVFGEKGYSYFVGRFIPSYRGQVGIILSKRLYPIINSYFNDQTHVEKKTCLEGTTREEANAKINYWHKKANEVLEEDKFKELVAMANDFLKPDVSTSAMYYLLSSYCVEFINNKQNTVHRNGLGERAFGRNGDSAFVGRFLPSYRGQMGITLNNRQYKIITNYFNHQTYVEKKTCQQPGTGSTQAENNKVYWRGQARKALEEDEFNLLEKCVRSFLPKNGYVACVIP